MKEKKTVGFKGNLSLLYVVFPPLLVLKGIDFTTENIVFYFSRGLNQMKTILPLWRASSLERACAGPLPGRCQLEVSLAVLRSGDAADVRLGQALLPGFRGSSVLPMTAIPTFAFEMTSPPNPHSEFCPARSSLDQKQFLSSSVAPFFLFLVAAPLKVVFPEKDSLFFPGSLNN